jgi:translocation and assembly module TamA
LNSLWPRCLTDVRTIVGVVAVAVMPLVLASPAGAQALRYRLEIEAPRDLTRILRRGLSLSRWQNDAQMSAEQLRRLAQDAVREAREVAATEGYFSAQVDVNIEETAPEWTVKLKIDPGPRTRVSDVTIRFTGPAERDPEAAEAFKRVRQAWRLRRGQPFRQADWDTAKREAVREFASWRYAAARIADSKAEIDPESREARLTLELASGPAFRFGPVRLTGMRRFPDPLAQNLSPIREGATYDRDLVLLYQRRLLETNYFASVQAEIDTDPLLADSAPLRGGALLEPGHLRVGVALQDRLSRGRQGAAAADRLRLAAAPGRALAEPVRARARRRHPERGHAGARRRRIAELVLRHGAARAHRVGAPRGAARARRPRCDRQPARDLLRPSARLPQYG